MIIEKFEHQVERCPGKLAVKAGHRSLTYAALNSQANWVAQEILRIDKPGAGSTNTSPTTVVSLLFEHGSDVLAAMLGSLKAQRTYVLLDIDYPVSRLSDLLKDSEASLLVTNRKNQPLAERLAAQAAQPGRGIGVLTIDSLNSETPATNPERKPCGNYPAYILYTSGSTGKPKGVVQTHDSVLYFIRHWTQRFSITGFDHITLLASLTHDGAIPDIYGALLSGATLYPFDVKKSADFNELKEWLVREKITVWHSVPTLYRYFTRHLNETDRFPDLRLLVLGGEEVTEYDILVFNRFFPGARLANIYGQTESTVNSIWLISGGDQFNHINIGKPIGETQIFLVDDSGVILEEMGVGEIVVASDHVALGYWKDKELSRKVFTMDSDLGRLYWTGDLGRLNPDGSIRFNTFSSNFADSLSNLPLNI